MIYLDHNAGAPLRPEVARHLERAFAETAGNPSSVHQIGRRARQRLDAAREAVARAFGTASPREIVFTGSGSEAAALGVLGAFKARGDRSKTTVVTSAIEHPAVLLAMRRLELQGTTVIRVSPRPDGAVDADELISKLDATVALCSLMWVNNETGVIQPVPAVSRACVERGIVFHTDAVQAVGKISCTLRDAPADLLSFSAHKLGGPAGVGVLINRRQVDVAALTPGHQENGRRGGTQSVALAEALVLALDASLAEAAVEQPRLEALRDELERAVVALPNVSITGLASRVANTANVCFHGRDAEALLIALDLEGVCVSTGAACASGSLTPSHVLLAMGLSAADASGSLRFSLGPGTTPEQIRRVGQLVTSLVS